MDIKNTTSDTRLDLSKKASDMVQWLMINIDFLCKKDASGRKKSILVVGCGTARNAHYMSSLGHNVVGFDMSEENIRLSKYRYSLKPVETDHSFFVHNLEDTLPFKTNSFDIVVDIFVYNEQPSSFVRTEYIKEIHRVLNDGGYLLLGVHGWEDEYYVKIDHKVSTFPKLVFDSHQNKNILCYTEEDLLREMHKRFEISMKWEQKKYQVLNNIKFLRHYLVTLLQKV